MGRSKGAGASGKQRRLLDRLEHDAGHLARGAVHAGARQISRHQTTARRLHVGDVEEALAAEEVLAGIRDAALHSGFAGRMDGDGGVDDEAAILGVLEEDAVEARRVAIGPGDDGREIVDDEAPHDAAEERPGGSRGRRARRRDPAAG